MERMFSLLLVALLLTGTILSGCGKGADSAASEEAGTQEEIVLDLLNVKSEVNSQIESLAAKYQQETGVTVNVIAVPVGVDAQANLWCESLY